MSMIAPSVSTMSKRSITWRVGSIQQRHCTDASLWPLTELIKKTTSCRHEEPTDSITSYYAYFTQTEGLHAQLTQHS